MDGGSYDHEAIAGESSMILSCSVGPFPNELKVFL